MEKEPTQPGKTYRIITFCHRLAFIVNLFFFVCLVLLYTSIKLPEFFNGLSITLGWFVSPFLNFFVLTATTILVIKNGRQVIQLPVIASFNLLVFLFQVIYHLIL